MASDTSPVSLPTLTMCLFMGYRFSTETTCTWNRGTHPRTVDVPVDPQSTPGLFRCDAYMINLGRVPSLVHESATTTGG